MPSKFLCLANFFFNYNAHLSTSSFILASFIKSCSHNSNLYWIYLLYILEIKEETHEFDLKDRSYGSAMYFMNMDTSINASSLKLYRYQKFDKHRILPFKYIYYIKFRSNQSIWQAYNIIVNLIFNILGGWRPLKIILPI